MNEYYIIDDSESHNICWICLSTNQDVRIMTPEEVIWYQALVSKILHVPLLHICAMCGHLLKKHISFTQQCEKACEIILQMQTNTSISLVPFKSNHNYCISGPRTILCSEESIKDSCDLKSDNCFVFQYDNVAFHNNDIAVQNIDGGYTYADAVFTNNDAGYTNSDAGYTNDDGFMNNDVGFTDSYIEINNDKIGDDDELPLILFIRNNDNVLGLNDELITKTSKKKQMKTNKNDIEPGIKVNDPNDAPDIEIPNCGKVKKKFNKDNKQGFSSRMVQETDEYLVIKLTKDEVLQEMTERANSENYKRSLYKCDKCVKGFNFEEVLRGHMKKHTQESGELLCDICGQYCPSAVSLRGHMKSHTTRYKCKVCSAVRLSRQHLLEHYALSHTTSASLYSCQYCQFATKKRTVIQRHVRSHNAEKKHACDLCGRLFTNIASLRVHTARHDKSKALRCSHCSRKFIYPSLLEKHVRAVHEHSEYYCVECDVTFKSPDNLRLHFKRAKKHRDPSSYTHECPQCNQKFISAPSLAVHLTLMHGQPKTHECKLCSRLYSNRQSLQGHMRRRHANKKK